MVRLVIILLLSFIGWTARAEQHPEAYRVETLVASQAEAERITAIKIGLGDVILQVTGDPAAVQHPLVRHAIGAASDYLLQFSYTADRDKNGSPAVKLTLNYSPQAIESLLQKAQLPLWSNNKAKDAQTFMVRIDKVQDFTAYKQIRSYLAAITMIRRSELLSVSKDSLMLRVTLDGDLALLKNILATDQKLQIDDAIVDSASAQNNPLLFYWKN